MDFGGCWVVLGLDFVSVLGSMVVITPLPNVRLYTPSRIKGSYAPNWRSHGDWCGGSGSSSGNGDWDGLCYKFFL